MNPVDHPMGGGEGELLEVVILLLLGANCPKAFQRKKSKTSNSQILVRRNGRRIK